MGQYFIPVNVTKREYIHAHAFGDGLKMGEWYPGNSRTHEALKALQTSRWKGDEIVIAGDYDHEEIYRQAREEFSDVSEQAKALLSGKTKRKDKVHCFDSKCEGGRTDLRYVQRSIEYHSIDSMPNEDGYCDLTALEDSYNDEDFTPYITCNLCGRDFLLDGTEKK